MRAFPIKNHWQSFNLKIVLPAVLAIVLFIISLYVFILPAYKNNIINYKREMIRELTHSAWSVFDKYEKERNKQLLTLEEAQLAAIAEIRALRYGEERKDYFWITDMTPSMVMHPYRIDLEGKSLLHFRDPHGKRLFVEFAAVVQQQGEGYVDYMWQWKDDSTRIVPKLSYVKGFEPWNWIIGTGVYIEDVKEEIQRMESNLIIISTVITIFIILLLAINLRQSISIEKNRQKAETELKESRERYKALVEASSEGTIMLMEEYSYANKTMLQFLGYTEEEFYTLAFSSISADDAYIQAASDFNLLISMLDISQSFKTRLRHKDGRSLDVLINSSKISFGNKNAIILLAKDLQKQPQAILESNLQLLHFTGVIDSLGVGFFTTILARRSKFIEANPAAIELLGFTSEDEIFQANIEDLFSDQQERKLFVKELITCGKISRRTIRIKKADGMSAYIMVSLKVRKEEGRPDKLCDGIVEDVTERVISEMARENVMKELQLSVSDQPLGMLADRIRKVQHTEELSMVQAELKTIITNYLNIGVNPGYLTQVISSVSDLIIEFIVNRAIAQTGTPPVQFSFICLGSVGREEQTLATDQDNAIIYQDVPDEKEKAVNSYFLKLGEKICDWLNQAGYTYCKGEIMAKTPRYCKPLSVWKKYFHSWVSTNEPKDLLDVSIFFDFRHKFGDKSLADELKVYLEKVIDQNGTFFYHLAANTLTFKPPLGIFGNIISENNPGHPDGFDSKKALMPIVGYARIYALKYGIDQANTLVRLTKLNELSVIPTSDYIQVCQAYDLLMTLRFRHQIKQLQMNQRPDNYINPALLTELEQMMLKKVFTQISALQSKMSLDFKGSIT